jgi:cytochrome c peroxidase
MRQLVAKTGRRVGAAAGVAAVLVLGGVIFNGTVSAFSTKAAPPDQAAAVSLFQQGRQIFRQDTFGDEAFWGDTLHLNQAIAGAKSGGVGPGVSPKTALSVGLKVDATAIPPKTAAAIKAGKVNLDDPATTVALLKLNAVVGVKGFFSKNGQLSSMGITCALCHSTVDDSFAPGIGKRLDGHPNRDLNVGAIISLAPNKKPITDLLKVDEPTVDKVLASWGPGKFDAEIFLDGKAFRPDGKSAATLIPPAFGLAGVNLHTYTGWGSVPYWNAFVAILEMHGKGNFTDSRLDDATKFPVAARAGFGHVRTDDDRVSSKLPALQYYQLGLKAPTPPAGSFDPAAAKRGQALFMGKGRCADCHVPPTFTEPGFNMHKPSEICTDSFQADRSPDGMYRTTPLRGAWSHAKGGFYHDGRFQSFGAVVDHYDSCFNLGLSAGEKTDIVEYLKSL